MAVKTKQMIQNELDAANKKLKEAESKLNGLPETLRTYIDKYGLDLCDDGLTDFCEAMGVEWSNMVPAQVTITFSGFELNKVGRWGELDFDPLHDKIYNAIRAIPEFASIYPDIEFDEY